MYKVDLQEGKSGPEVAKAACSQKLLKAAFRDS